MSHWWVSPSHTSECDNAHETLTQLAALYRYSPALMHDRGTLDKNLRADPAIVIWKTSPLLILERDRS
jgi:hypothetical protein